MSYHPGMIQSALRRCVTGPGVRSGLPLALALFASCGGSEPPDERSSEGSGESGAVQGRPNIVLIVIDTLRADHLGLYGYPDETAPFLAKLGAQSAVFERTFSSSSWTAPATASVMTGLYPTRHGLTRGFFAQQAAEDAVQQGGMGSVEVTPLSQNVETLAESLERAGWATRGFATNRNVCDELGLSRGFAGFILEYFDAQQVFEVVSGWQPILEKAEPYFLYLHFNDVHRPYTPRSPWYEPAQNELDETVERYDSEISFLDSALERLYEVYGWDHNTLLWLVSDHGEEFQDHGAWGHTFSLHQELVHVLMLAHGPDLGIAPARIDVNTSLVDVYPTLLDFVGVPPAAGCDGLSLKALLSGDEAAAADLRERVLFAHRQRAGSPPQIWAALLGDYKLIERDDGVEPLLFNFALDPGERQNVLEANAPMAEILGEQLERFRAETAGSSPSEGIDVPIDRKALEELKALGYFGED